MDGGRPEMRRTMTLSEQLSSTPDPAIRDFLKIPQDADVGGILHDEDSPSAVDAQGPRAGRTSGWKPLRDRLRLRRAAGAWQTPPNKPGAAAAHAPTNSGNLSNRYNYNPGEAAAAFSRTFSRAPSLRAPSLRATPTFSRVASTRLGPASSRSSSRRPATYDFRDVDERRHDADADDGGEEEDDEGEDDDDEGDEEDEKEEAPAAQMSLMALLEQTDSQWDDDEDEEESGGGGGARKKGEGDDDEDDGEGREEEMVHVCCVCMVRHKGAAFIPCGHTFCRLCSRELWVSRGNCPLCNGFIQEILDIF
ncbi:putative RING zinc finger domain superfamily protein [Zea mays]|jgi:hypothetical protein|uniref:RING/U-box superfamily protein n=1 Tax=Zea mays TaxID=4577 RepID=C0HIL5_MAIZE|nr:putative RING zinc finger domain superfamily protein [Zea mays]ACN26868.1 unknown [Zea mays]ONM35140.1 RING/U-box superfamily protein [Zea mays]|eukprot:NP_001168025.1 putative RING zinc finger domain superfamily protein [Zea mays]